MKAKTTATLVLFFGLVAVCFAQSSQMGTWKLNEAKSKLAANAPVKNNTVVYEMAGDNVKVTVDGTRDGKPMHSEWTGKFDGKDYPVTGDPAADARSYKQIDENTLELSIKKDGKVTTTGRIVTSADGKTRTVTTNGTDAQGKKIESVAVYDKQT